MRPFIRLVSTSNNTPIDVLTKGLRYKPVLHSFDKLFSMEKLSSLLIGKWVVSKIMRFCLPALTRDGLVGYLSVKILSVNLMYG